MPNRAGRVVEGTQLAQRSALLRLPNWLWGGSIDDFANAAGWHLDPEDPATGKWRLRLRERVQRRPGRLIQVSKLADARNVDAIGAYGRLRRLPDQDPFMRVDAGAIQAELDRRAKERPNDLAAWFSSGFLATVGAPQAQLVQVVQQVLRGLLPVLSGAAVYLAEVDPALAFRYGATRVLLQVEDDPTLLNQPPQEFRGFNSARGLFSDTTLGLAAYLSPLLLSVAPWVWGIAAPRTGGIIIYTFGEAVIGRRGEAAEVLQMFLPQSPPSNPPRPSLTPTQLDAALHWWIARVDELFTEITDPASYRAADDTYLVRRNFEVLLSVEQAFRNVQSLSAHHRDGHARRVLLFDTLDTLAGIGGPNFDSMCQLREAERALAEVEERVTEAAAPVLLPRARAAVDALRALQQGFFLTARVTPAGIRAPGKQGRDEILSPEQAAATLPPYLAQRRTRLWRKARKPASR